MSLRWNRIREASLGQLFWLGCVGVVLAVPCSAEELVPAGSTWKWWHSEVGVDPAADDKDFNETFFRPDFDDSSWKEGQDAKGPTGGFGYGNVANAEFDGVKIGTPSEAEDRKTAYFRIKFNTTEDFERLTLKCQRDDGIIVYLNGDEVLRDNIDKEAKEAYALFANTTVSGNGEKTLNSFPFAYELDAGEHVLVIALHNRAGGSSDLRIAEISLESREADNGDDEKEGSEEVK